jgi:hypothetical protein
MTAVAIDKEVIETARDDERGISPFLALSGSGAHMLSSPTLLGAA